ncbi:hypothetical protein BDE02_08G127700 [Populus trichocarpa]|nr:hypothetical protein BDE02_08G127700 [Populus trichocarpa]
MILMAACRMFFYPQCTSIQGRIGLKWIWLHLHPTRPHLSRNFLSIKMHFLTLTLLVSSFSRE